jgi:hypothetical protein
MLPTDAKIISVDDHVIEHPRVWPDRLPAKCSNVAPPIVNLGRFECSPPKRKSKVKSTKSS